MHVHVTTYIWVIKEECHLTIWHHSVSEKCEKSKEFNVKYHKKIRKYQKKIKTSSQRKKNLKKNFTDEVVDVFFMFLCFAISQIFQEFWQVVLIKMSNNNVLVFLFTFFNFFSLSLTFYLKFYSLLLFVQQEKLWKK